MKFHPVTETWWYKILHVALEILVYYFSGVFHVFDSRYVHWAKGFPMNIMISPRAININLMCDTRQEAMHYSTQLTSDVLRAKL